MDDEARAYLEQVIDANTRLAEAHGRALARHRILTPVAEPPPVTVDVSDERDRLIADLRSILAPLLDAPRFGDGDWCVFCLSAEHAAHAPDCPVLRRDELLGRTPS